MGLARVDYWLPWAERGGRVLVILAGAWLVTRVVRRLLSRLRAQAARAMDHRTGQSGTTLLQIDIDRRSATVVTALAKLAAFLIWMVAIVMALNELTFNVQPLLAGLGVAGLALGLGAQALIKDWLGGLLVIVEDQMRIGDSVVINGIAGVVEEINLRTTVLRGENGAVHIVANGLITTLSNLTREYVFYVFEATLAHGTDADRAIEILRETATALAREDEFAPAILAPVEVMGVDRLADRGLLLRARIKTVPGKQYLVGRELNRRVNARWLAAGLKFPPVS